MRRFGFALACGVLAAGTAAHAQSAGGIDNIQSTAGTSVFSSPNSDPAVFGQGAGTTGNGNPPGAKYNSFVTVAPNFITFESENTSRSPFVDANSYSTVSFDVHNNTGQTASFGSTITAAGLGFYLADTSSGCGYSCPQVAAGSYTFNDLVSNGGIASVGFQFEVSRAATFGNTATSLYSLNGSLGMGRDGPVLLFDNLGDIAPPSGARGLLSGFRETVGDDFNPLSVAGIGGATAIGYAWNATDFTFNIGSLANQTLVYTTQVNSTTSAPCVAGTSICLVAYSGFGDPVGRGGGTESFASFVFGAQQLDPAPPRIGGLSFSPTTLNTPTFDGRTGAFRAPNAVPEPATWMTLILGFGMLGAVLRRRRTFANA